MGPLAKGAAAWCRDALTLRAGRCGEVKSPVRGASSCHGIGGRVNGSLVCGGRRRHPPGGQWRGGSGRFGGVLARSASRPGVRHERLARHRLGGRVFRLPPVFPAPAGGRRRRAAHRARCRARYRARYRAKHRRAGDGKGAMRRAVRRWGRRSAPALEENGAGCSRLSTPAPASVASAVARSRPHPARRVSPPADGFFRAAAQRRLWKKLRRMSAACRSAMPP